MISFSRITITTLQLAATVAAASTISLPAGAHAIWFAQRAKQIGLIYGVGADDLDTVKRIPLIKSVKGYGADWSPINASVRAAGAVVLIDPDAQTTAITAVMDNGIWSKAEDGEFYRGGRDVHPASLRSEHTYKFAVTLTGPMTTPMPLFPDQVVQITPVGAAIPAQKGMPMTVRVTLNGKPLAGAPVIFDFVNDPDQVPEKTNSEGLVTFKVPNQGLNVIQTMVVDKPDNAKIVDRIVYDTTLSFTLAHKPEE